MLIHDFVLKHVAGSVALIALAASATAAGAPDLTITDAKIAAGKLVITGTTARPGMRLRLDGKSAADFNITSKSDRHSASVSSICRRIASSMYRRCRLPPGLPDRPT